MFFYENIFEACSNLLKYKTGVNKTLSSVLF